MIKYTTMLATALALMMSLQTSWAKDSEDEDDANEPDRQRMSGFCAAEFAYRGPAEEREAILDALKKKPVYKKSVCRVLTNEKEVAESAIFQKLILPSATSSLFNIVVCDRPHRNLFKVTQNLALRFNKSSNLTYLMAATRCPAGCFRSSDCDDGYARCIKNKSDATLCDQRC